MAGHGNTSYLVVFNGPELARRGDQRIASNECRRTKNYSMGLYRMGLCIRTSVFASVAESLANFATKDFDLHRFDLHRKDKIFNRKVRQGFRKGRKGAP